LGTYSSLHNDKAGFFLTLERQIGKISNHTFFCAVVLHWEPTAVCVKQDFTSHFTGRYIRGGESWNFKFYRRRFSETPEQPWVCMLLKICTY
jgi:hypothetical protein